MSSTRSVTDLRLGAFARTAAISLALLGVLSLVGECVLVGSATRYSVVAVLRWGATLLGIWFLLRTGWSGRLQLGTPRSRA